MKKLILALLIVSCNSFALSMNGQTCETIKITSLSFGQLQSTCYPYGYTEPVATDKMTCSLTYSIVDNHVILKGACVPVATSYLWFNKGCTQTESTCTVVPPDYTTNFSFIGTNGVLTSNTAIVTFQP